MAIVHTVYLYQINRFRRPVSIIYYTSPHIQIQYKYLYKTIKLNGTILGNNVLGNAWCYLAYTNTYSMCPFLTILRWGAHLHMNLFVYLCSKWIGSKEVKFLVFHLTPQNTVGKMFWWFCLLFFFFFFLSLQYSTYRILLLHSQTL